MKHKTAELEGVDLDAAVALALGATMVQLPKPKQGDIERIARVAKRPDGSIMSLGSYAENWNPSMQWDQGGTLIERFGICLIAKKPGWTAAMDDFSVFYEYETSANGPTALIAAMRALVLEKLGEEVELP